MVSVIQDIEKNYNIVEKKMIAQMEEALEFGKELINSELDTGLLNFLIKPVITSFYKYWCDHDARKGTLEQIKITLDSAKKLVNNGFSQEKFDRIIEEGFPIYLEGDQTFRQCRSQHKNYNKLKEISKLSFISQVQDAILFLEVEDDSNGYDELVKKVFKDKEHAYNSLMRQLNYTDEGIKIVEEDPSILKVPTGKRIILKVLRKGFDKTKSELVRRLDNIFG